MGFDETSSSVHFEQFIGRDPDLFPQGAGLSTTRSVRYATTYAGSRENQHHSQRLSEAKMTESSYSDALTSISRLLAMLVARMCLVLAGLFVQLGTFLEISLDQANTSTTTPQ
ncbi:hypothetical protein CRM22_010785 [Opisthorchis felineus]|uniref:Uncharacterized protein n=1 Tax=Opisthorchis felineus TaxID=147828 RepID=A0A4S2KL24_OPIFE|nr:hypothetical protein CRM22_010785 [Opisthorchis felineus]